MLTPSDSIVIKMHNRTPDIKGLVGVEGISIHMGVLSTASEIQKHYSIFLNGSIGAMSQKLYLSFSQ